MLHSLGYVESMHDSAGNSDESDIQREIGEIEEPRKITSDISCQIDYSYLKKGVRVSKSAYLYEKNNDN